MSPKYCVLFAGQSVQAQGMCKDLWRISAARQVLERLKPSLGDDLEHITTEMAGPDLAKTFNAQRAIHAHHLGNWFAYRRRLRRRTRRRHRPLHGRGRGPGRRRGHERGGIRRFHPGPRPGLRDVCKTFAEPQGMAAVITKSLREVKDKIEAFPGVSLALHNTMGKGTIGGKLSDIEAFAAHAKKEGWPMKVMVLKVEGPYHTAAFAPCKPALKAAVDKITITPPRAPVFMGTSGLAELIPRASPRCW